MNEIILQPGLIYSGSLILVNKIHPIYTEHSNQSELTLLSEESQPILLEKETAAVLERLIGDINGRKSILAVSGYRTQKEQRAIYSDSLKANGPDFTRRYVALPNHSEHQTGLCCDITDIYYPTKNRSIENTAMFQYMNAHCQEFGFILRFPDGMEPITGVMYEPFHFRYVGVEAAKYITENNICFETFVSLYRDIGTAENPQES